MRRNTLRVREIRSLDLAAAFGGRWRESGTTIERARWLVAFPRSFDCPSTLTPPSPGLHGPPCLHDYMCEVFRLASALLLIQGPVLPTGMLIRVISRVLAPQPSSPPRTFFACPRISQRNWPETATVQLSTALALKAGIDSPWREQWQLEALWLRPSQFSD